jgi:hypothetical protein
MALGAHYDKYDPISGGFRAPSSQVWTGADLRVPRAVSLDANGRVVRGTAGVSGFVGVVVAHKDVAIGDVLDVMTQGEIVDVTGLTAGTRYYATAAGPLGTAAPAAGVNAGLVGWTVESDRLVVRAGMVQG